MTYNVFGGTLNPTLPLPSLINPSYRICSTCSSEVATAVNIVLCVVRIRTVQDVTVVTDSAVYILASAIELAVAVSWLDASSYYLWPPVQAPEAVVFLVRIEPIHFLAGCHKR